MIERAPPISSASYAQLIRAHSIVGSRPDIFEPDSTLTILITYGFGWDIRSYYGDLLIEHCDAQPGYATGVFCLPRRKSGLVLLSNNMLAGFLAIHPLPYSLIENLLQIPDKEWVDLVPWGD